LLQLVEQVITDIQNDPKFKGGCWIVRLNGNLCTDFRTALFTLISSLKHVKNGLAGSDDDAIMERLNSDGDFNGVTKQFQNKLKYWFNAFRVMRDYFYSSN